MYQTPNTKHASIISFKPNIISKHWSVCTFLILHVADTKTRCSLILNIDFANWLYPIHCTLVWNNIATIAYYLSAYCSVGWYEETKSPWQIVVHGWRARLHLTQHLFASTKKNTFHFAPKNQSPTILQKKTTSHFAEQLYLADKQRTSCLFIITVNRCIQSQTKPHLTRWSNMIKIFR